MYDDLTCRENLLLQGRLVHIPGKVLRQRVSEFAGAEDPKLLLAVRTFRQSVR